MDREASVNVAEKKRLRDAIDEQVRRYLENGGHIEVLEPPVGAPGIAAHGAGWGSVMDGSPPLD